MRPSSARITASSMNRSVGLIALILLWSDRRSVLVLVSVNMSHQTLPLSRTAASPKSAAF